MHRINGIPFERLPRFPASGIGRVGVDSYGEMVEKWDDVLLLAVFIQVKEAGKEVIQFIVSHWLSNVSPND